MITSTRNPHIQWVRKLQERPAERREAGMFLVEGVRLAEEALAASWGPRMVLFSDELSERGQALLEGFAAQGAEVVQVSAAVLQACSAAQHAQGILAVLPIHLLPLPDELDFIFIPDGMRDPGNLGSMLRTASAAGVQAVLLMEGSVDPWSPKVVRAAMGAHFRLPLLSLTWQEIESLLSKRGIQLYLASAHSGIPYLQADFCKPLGVLIGGEAEGASPAGRALAQQEVRIPMPGGGESLNAAAAAAILLFEVVRQRNAP